MEGHASLTKYDIYYIYYMVGRNLITSNFNHLSRSYVHKIRFCQLKYYSSCHDVHCL